MDYLCGTTRSATQCCYRLRWSEATSLNAARHDSDSVLDDLMNYLFALVALAVASTATAQNVEVIYDHTAPQPAYAARKLSEALKERGYSPKSDRTKSEIQLQLELQPALAPEAFTVMREGKLVHIRGGDQRGLIYGAL